MLVWYVWWPSEPEIEHHYANVTKYEQESDDYQCLCLEPVESLLLNQYENDKHKLGQDKDESEHQQNDLQDVDRLLLLLADLGAMSRRDPALYEQLHHLDINEYILEGTQRKRKIDKY